MPASSVTVGENQFMFAEDFDEMNADQPIARYYHKYENGNCYEFALGIATDRNDTKEEVRAIDRDAVFEKLEKIVASAQIESKDEVKPAATVEVGHDNAAGNRENGIGKDRVEPNGRQRQSLVHHLE